MIDWASHLRQSLERRGAPVDADVVEELGQHAAASFERAIADGLDAADAEARVRALLDGWCRVTPLRHGRSHRAPLVEPPTAASRGWTGFAQDLRYGVRQVRRQPGFTALATVLIALGVGAATTLCSLAYFVLMKPLPWPDADRLATVIETRDGATRQTPNTFTNATYLSWREAPGTIEGLAGYSSRLVTVTGEAEPERLRVVSSTASLFALLRSHPAHGALFTEADEAVDHTRVVVLSYGLWQRRFGARPEAVGQTLEVDGEPYRVLGVMPRDFWFPTQETQAWMPLHVTPVLEAANPNSSSRSVSLFRGLARLKPGITAAQASGEATARGRAAPDLGMVGTAVFGTQGKPRVTVTPYLEAQTADVRPALSVLIAAVVMLLAAAVANVAGMQLARATTRRREVAIRSALGAGPGRLARQLLTENLVIGAAGGLGGWLIAAALLQVLPHLLPADFPRTGEIIADWRVPALAVGAALFASLAFGAVPALIARRLNLVEALVEDNLAPVGAGLRTRIGRLRTLIMAGQVAIAVVLLIGASLFGRSFVALLGVDRGYEPQHLLTATLPMADRRFTGQRRAATIDAILDRLAQTPGVAAAAGASVMPLLPYDQPLSFQVRASTPGVLVPVQANLRTISPDYFQALGMRIVEGRGLSGTDTLSTLPVVVVNRAFAHKYLSQPVIGVRLPIGLNQPGTEWREIVGVVEDVRQQAATDAPQPEIFASYRQLTEGIRMNAPVLVVRTSGDPAALIPTLRALVRAEDSTLVVDSVMTMEDRLQRSLARPRLYMLLLATFAGFALLVSSAGLFGVLSYNVAQRSREIGVRAAMGANPRAIILLVARQGLAIAALGVASGLSAAYLLVTLIGTLLYGVKSHDPISFALVPVIVLIVAALACAVPARRAARIDPLAALRQR